MFLIFAMAVPVSMLAQQSKAEKEVRDTIEEMRQAILKGGPEAAVALDKYYPDDYVRIPGDGRLAGKAEMLNGYRAGTQKVELLEYSDIKVHTYGNWAIATGMENTKRLNLGKPYAAVYRWTRVMAKRDGIWKVVVFQHTPIAGAAKQ